MFLDQTHDPRPPGDGPPAQEALMQRSDFDFDVISGPASPPPRPAAESGPAMPRPQPASLDPARVRDETPGS